MGAPKRLRLDVGGASISAFLLPEMAAEDVPAVVCKDCAPTRTRMRQQAEVWTMTKSNTTRYAVFICNRCRRQWAVPYASEKTLQEAS